MTLDCAANVFWAMRDATLSKRPWPAADGVQSFEYCIEPWVTIDLAQKNFKYIMKVANFRVMMSSNQNS